jgi:hypothetical protein
LVEGGPAMLDLETELPTPNGFVKLGDLKEGDCLFDEKGNVCNIIKLYSIDNYLESYKVIFDDETTINARADYLWLTWDKKARKYWYNNTFPPKVRTTKEILDTLKTKTSKVETNHSIENTLPLNYSEKDLLIDPYVLGCWLGDGRSSNGSIECADQEILDEIKKAGYSYNKTGKKITKSKSSNYRLGDRIPNDSGKTTIGRLTKELRSLNLIENKSIPELYLISSYKQRLSLLQGLMDTDGTCGSSKKHNGHMEFCSTLPKLANQVLLLANSLGIKAKLHKNKSFLYGKKYKDRYRVTFITKLPVFRLKRKLANIKKSHNQSTRNTHRYIVDIQNIPSVLMRSIIVNSSSQLYLITRSFIPVFNI